MIVNKLYRPLATQILGVKNLILRQFFWAESFTILPPRYADIVIFDATGSSQITELFETKSTVILHVRGEKVNLFCLVWALTRFLSGQQSLLLQYSFAFIRTVRPKCIITTIDNSLIFTQLSPMTNIQTVFFQNGVRSYSDDIFESIDKSKKLSFKPKVDYMFVHGSAIASKYSEYIDGKTFAAGSVLSNSCPVTKSESNSVVTFISQFRASLIKSNFYYLERAILPLIASWCKSNKKLLQIAGFSQEISCIREEKYFYSSILKDLEFVFTPRLDKFSTYNHVDASDVVISCDSSMGFESASRGNKTAFFSRLAGEGAMIFGWPSVLSSNGPFWTDSVSASEVNRLMTYISNIKTADFQEIWKQYGSPLMIYDQDNRALRNILADIRFT